MANLESANLQGAGLVNANLVDAIMKCLKGCPSALPEYYICEPDPDCEEEGRFRIVDE